jgi:hypothetical protein
VLVYTTTGRFVIIRNYRGINPKSQGAAKWDSPKPSKGITSITIRNLVDGMKWKRTNRKFQIGENDKYFLMVLMMRVNGYSEKQGGIPRSNGDSEE